MITSAQWIDNNNAIVNYSDGSFETLTVDAAQAYLQYLIDGQKNVEENTQQYIDYQTEIDARTEIVAFVLSTPNRP